MQERANFICIEDFEKSIKVIENLMNEIKLKFNDKEKFDNDFKSEVNGLKKPNLFNCIDNEISYLKSTINTFGEKFIELEKNIAILIDKERKKYMQYLVSKLPDINKEIKDNGFFSKNSNFVSKDNQINLLNSKIQDQGIIIKKLIKKIKILELEKNNDNDRNNNKDFFEFATCCSIFKSSLYNEYKKDEYHQSYNKLFNLNCINKSFMENGFLAESDLNVKSNLKRCNSAKLIENRKAHKLQIINNQNLSQIKNNNINSALNMSLISNDSIKIVKMSIKDKLKQYRSNLKSNEINIKDNIDNNTQNNQKSFHYNMINTNKKASNKMINSDTRKIFQTKYKSNEIIKTIATSNDSIHKNINLNKFGVGVKDNNTNANKGISKKILKYTNSIIDKTKKKSIITNIAENKAVNKIVVKGGKFDNNNHNQIVKLPYKNNSSALIKTNKAVDNNFKNKNDSNEVGQLIPINKDLIRGKKIIEKDKLSRNMSSLNCGKEFIIGEVLQKSFRTKDTNDDNMY